jgi:carbamoyl-phosphate synthase large subunit
VIVQFGGQTPLNLADKLHNAGVPIIGTSPDSIDLAEDRKRFGKLLEDLKIPSPANGTAISAEEAKAIAGKIGYPIIVRPSYVLADARWRLFMTNKVWTNICERRLMLRRKNRF